jgi:hypothetical protein
MNFLILIIWLLYSAFEGIRESYYWWLNSKFGGDIGFNIHIIFALQRGLVILMTGLLIDIFLAMSLMLTFSFIHNGFYYLGRGFISKSTGEKNPYPKGFFSQSTTSTAITTKIFTPTIRTISFILGIISLFLFTFK